MGYFNFFIFKKIYYYLKKKISIRTLFFIIIFILIFCFLSSNNVFATEVETVEINATEDIYQEIIEKQRIQQDRFVMHCLAPFFSNSEMWQEGLAPYFR